MHHDRLKPYDCEVIPAWIKCQRSQILQNGKETPDNPIIQEPLLEPEQLATRTQGEQGKERRWQPAASRHRQNERELKLMSAIEEKKDNH